MYGLALHTLTAPDKGRGNAFPDSEEGNALCLEEEEESANAEGHKARVVETDAIASSLSAQTATNPHISDLQVWRDPYVPLKTRVFCQEPKSQ